MLSHHSNLKMLLGMKLAFEHQDMEIKQIWVIFTHWQLWVAVAKNNFQVIENFNYLI